jgi:hypothetical protein
MNGRYTMDIEGKYEDDKGHTVYPLQFQSTTIHAGDKERMKRPGLTIGMKREDVEPWFQREFEEAEIIKFPEPEKKVIELPNVQSYPDFLTGVKDLHNRRDRGEISQDSHDKLYADLIQRFMRKESFETPWFLRESTAEQNIDQLEKIANQDPKKAGIISQAFDKILQFTNKVLGQKPQQTENTAQLAQQADLIKIKMAELRKLGDFKNEKKLETFLNNLFKTIDIQATGRANREIFQKRAGIRIELQKAIDLIAGKVNGTLEKLEQQYKKQKKADDPNVVIKTSPGDEKIRNAISIVLRGLIAKYQAKFNDEKKFNQFEKLIFDFLNASKQGIIPLGSLVDQGGGNIKDAVLKTKFKQLSTMGFIDELLDLMPAQTGGAWGPGELGLAILGSPVSKGDKGDIMVGNRKIEIKASNDPKKGGRINTSAVKNGKAGKAGAAKAIANFFSKIKQKFDGKSIGVTKTGKPVNAYNVNSLSWMQAINQVIQQAKAKRTDVIKFLDELSTAAINVPATGEIKFDYSGAVASDGTVIPNEFRKEYLRVILAYYNAIEQVNDILIINPSNGNFNVVDATDIESIMKKLNDGILGTGTTLINFTDSQAKLSPQLGVY